MKKFLLVLVCCLILCNSVFALPSPTTEFYVADYSGLLSTETKEYIINHSNTLYEKTGAQIVVATIDTIDGRDEREYGLELAREWKIGSKEDNGVLILLAMEEGAITVEVGYGLEGALNDAKAGRFIDSYAIDYFRQGNFDLGLKDLYSAILAEVYKEYGLEVPENVDYVQPVSEEGSMVETIIILIVIILIIIINLKGGGRGIYFFPGGFGGGSSGGSRGGFGGGGSFGGGGASRRF